MEKNAILLRAIWGFSVPLCLISDEDRKWRIKALLQIPNKRSITRESFKWSAFVVYLKNCIQEKNGQDWQTEMKIMIKQEIGKIFILYHSWKFLEILNHRWKTQCIYTGERRYYFKSFYKLKRKFNQPF